MRMKGASITYSCRVHNLQLQGELRAIALAISLQFCNHFSIVADAPIARRAGRRKRKALPFACISTVFFSKTVPFMVTLQPSCRTLGADLV